jgi:hypothetical protein
MADIFVRRDEIIIRQPDYVRRDKRQFEQD